MKCQLLFSYIYFFADNISISMYIMYVILCLFSALSRRVGALQMSIIIINNENFSAPNPTLHP